MTGASQRPSAVAATLYANGTRSIGPGNPAGWQSAAPMADQDPTRMFQYIVGQLYNPHDMPTPDIDVTNGT
eukprot:8481109-Lingulodinium_polyedra.AAC.1